MDAESFKKEFLPYHRKLYCIAYRLLENAADAEDLVQEAYLKLWDKREGLAIISNPEAFSVTLVKNMCFDFRFRRAIRTIRAKSLSFSFLPPHNPNNCLILATYRLET